MNLLCQAATATDASCLLGDTKAPIDLVGDPPAERSDGLGLGVADRLPMSDIVGGWAAESDLRGGDAMQGYVQLPVAAAVEAMPLGVA